MYYIFLCTELGAIVIYIFRIKWDIQSITFTDCLPELLVIKLIAYVLYFFDGMPFRI